MKAGVVRVSVLLSVALTACAAVPPDDAVALSAAVPSVREIRVIRVGYSLVTDSGTRTAYKTRTGYYIEGGAGGGSLQLIRTATGYRVESSATRGAALGKRR